MSDFDDLLRNSKTDSNTKSSDTDSDKSSDSKKKSSSSASVAGMFGASDMAELTRKFNLDPEMGERVLVPLVNFLEKYGVADAVDTSPTASRLLNLAEFWNDIAPVVRNASDFFGGRKQTLDDSDKEFLERIRAAQNDSADMTLFQSDDDSPAPTGSGFVNIGESVETAPAPAPEPVELPKDPFTDGPVDWYDVLGAPNPSKKSHYETSGVNTRVETQFGINGLEQLAKEAGLSVDEVMSRDSQNKINRKSSDGVDYTSDGGIPTFQSGVDKIQAQMAAEAENHRRNSKISFEDLPTPESAEQYNPLAVDGLEMPSLKGGGLESLGSLAAKAGVSEDELKVQPVGSKEAEPQIITQEELSEVHDTPHVTIPENPDRPDSSTFLVDFE
jgi:uncharacterized protein YidB (DUF937 family)